MDEVPMRFRAVWTQPNFAVRIPIHDPSLSVNARLLWVALRDASVRVFPVITPDCVLGCDEAEAMAAVHELVAGGWLAVRWLGARLALAMVLAWPERVMRHECEWSEWEAEAEAGGE